MEHLEAELEMYFEDKASFLATKAMALYLEADDACLKVKILELLQKIDHYDF